MEPKPREQYKAGETTENVARECKNCQSLKGHLTQTRAPSGELQTWLELHGCELVVEVLHGRCTRCGSAYHFVQSDATLDRIIARGQRPSVREQMQAARVELGNS